MNNTASNAGHADIVEVAPRDGFQAIDKPLPTKTKIGIIEGLIQAGCKRIEFGSFVSPRAVPQMADMAEIAEHFRDTAGARLSALVPNLKGADAAVAHGVTDLVYVFSASEEHNQRNVRRSVAESLDELRAVQSRLETLPACHLRVNVATSFDCPFAGPISLETLRQALSPVWSIAPQAEIGLCDTTGRANPQQVGRYFRRLMAECPSPYTTWAFHGHDTFGLGVANALFAYEEGVRVFDASAAGLGGCPFAPGATGNTATEDLVFALHEAGIGTGIDLLSLLSVADRIAELPGGVTGGHIRVVPRERVA